MERAKEIKAELINSGTLAPSQLPKLEGPAGKSWFWRWRRKYGIVYRQTGMQLKVSWRKVIKRVRVELGNVFRLRALWAKCHPGIPMRWFSADQKPSWFNNAGASNKGSYTVRGRVPTVRENFAASRERYATLTSVWSGLPANHTPQVAVLFKGKPGGRILRDIHNNFDCPNWMHLQVQENGSYRCEDCVEAFDWMLPEAADSSESIVVLLDSLDSGLRSVTVQCTSLP